MEIVAVDLKQFKGIREMLSNDRLDVELIISRIYNFPRFYNIRTFNTKVAQHEMETRFLANGDANNLSTRIT